MYSDRERSCDMKNEKDFEEIMKQITGGLSGDYESDIKYLKEQGEKYRNNEYGTEILRAIGRMIYDLIPEGKKAELENALGKDGMGFDAALEEVRFNIYKKNHDKALKLIENMVKKYEDMNLFRSDNVSEYFCFKEPMEEIIYSHYKKSEKDIRRSPVNYAEMFLLYGSLLVDMQRIEDAVVALEKAVRWNPINAKIAFEYTETFKIRGMIEDFGKYTREIFKYVYSPDDLARCYRNMAYYFVELKDYKAAVCCLLYSSQFEKSEMVSSELYFISQQTGEMYQPSLGELSECFMENEIPLGPSEEVLKLAYSYGMHFHESGDDAGAEYFLRIVDCFIDDKELNTILKDIEKKKSI